MDSISSSHEVSPAGHVGMFAYIFLLHQNSRTDPSIYRSGDGFFIPFAKYLASLDKYRSTCAVVLTENKKRVDHIRPEQQQRRESSVLVVMSLAGGWSPHHPTPIKWRGDPVDSAMPPLTATRGRGTSCRDRGPCRASAFQATARSFA